MTGQTFVPAASTSVLAVNNLEVNFYTERGVLPAVRGVSFSIQQGETLGIVGESGSGKSVTAMALMGLIPPPGRIDGGTVQWKGEMTDVKQARRLRGRSITMIFQDPMASLNPLVTVGRQITEVLRKHKGMSRDQAKKRALDLLDLVGIPSPRTRLKQYPYELSGGMRQRVMIAIALAPEPELMIADEPTTALDTTIQAQILELIADLQERLDLSVILITHDLGVVADVCDRVLVMYAGKVVEQATATELFEHPVHPYSKGLLDSTPRLDRIVERLELIEGSPPVSLTTLPPCAFADRCWRSDELCYSEVPLLEPVSGSQRKAACWHAL